MVRFFTKKSKKTKTKSCETANVASTSSLKTRVEEVKARRSKFNEVDKYGIIRQVLIGSIAGCTIGISAIGLGKFAVLSIFFVSIILYYLNKWGCIQIDWNRVEEEEKILEEEITGEKEPKEKKTLTEKVIDEISVETTYLLSSKEKRKKKQINTIFQRFFTRAYVFIVSLLVGIAIGLVAGILLFS